MGRTGRYLNMALGLWLFISAFLWPHSQAQFTNSWLMGLLCIGFASLALVVPQFRYLNTALAVWLFISAFALPRISVATVWNNALVAIGIFVLSLAGAAAPLAVPRRPARVP